MIRFNPDPSYSGLLKQAYALHTLASSYERQLLLVSKKLDKVETRLKLSDESAINAERATNEILTNKLTELTHAK